MVGDEEVGDEEVGDEVVGDEVVGDEVVVEVVLAHINRTIAVTTAQLMREHLPSVRPFLQIHRLQHNSVVEKVGERRVAQCYKQSKGMKSWHRKLTFILNV